MGVVVGLHAGELAHVRPVGVHDVDVHVAVDVALEGDLRAVRRTGAGRVVRHSGFETTPLNNCWIAP
jgi:hypothetical protein